MAYPIVLRQGMAMLVLSMVCCQAMASVVITGTRLIYPANEKEITVILNNKGKLPVLVQTWVDSGDAKSTPTESTAPFVLSPPVFRMNPEASQSLRVMFTSGTLPTDKESIYWFNLLEVPSLQEASDTSNNNLQMAFRSRIKLFYRPSTLKGDVSEAFEKVQWQLVRRDSCMVLLGHNPSPFHLSITGLALLDGEQRFVGTGEMIAPGATYEFPLPVLKKQPSANAQIEINAINDFGADIVIKRPLTP